MKKISIGLIVVLLIMSGVFLDRYLIKAQIARADQGELLLAQNTDNTWIVKINKGTITLDEFEREFAVHVYSLPLEDDQKEEYESQGSNKKKFLNSLINEHLVYEKAVAEGYTKKRLVQDIMKAMSRRAVIQVYLNDKIEPKLHDIPDEQIEAVYNQNKKLFAGVDIDMARQQIKLQLLHPTVPLLLFEKALHAIDEQLF